MTFYENWVSGEKLNAHLTAPHLVVFVGMRFAATICESCPRERTDFCVTERSG
jgi:hypothetical protein